MAFELPPLPYELDALEPHFSRETLDFHYNKHHKTYVVKLNGLVEGTEQAALSLEELIRTSTGPVFNNAAQIWNHTFYWNGLRPNSNSESNEPNANDALGQAINSRFGSFSQFQELFAEKAINNFGSGWTWLVRDPDGTVDIVNTSNAQTPLTGPQIPLLTCDVWEHAYYIQYRNLRPAYLKAFWALVNWDFVQANFSPER